MRRFVIGAVSLCSLMAHAGHAVDLDGTYLLSVDGDCRRIGEDGGALQINANTFTGVESSCKMLNPVNVRDMDAQLFDMTCTSPGDDTTWIERAMMMRSATGGLILVWNGYAFQYERCAVPQPKN